jgi:hypothetical protein
LLKHPSKNQELDFTHFLIQVRRLFLDAAHACSDAREARSIWSLQQVRALNIGIPITLMLKKNTVNTINY